MARDAGPPRAVARDDDDDGARHVAAAEECHAEVERDEGDEEERVEVARVNRSAEACALYRLTMRRDAASAAMLRVLALAASAKGDEAREIRIDAETTLLVVDSGGTPVDRKRAAAAWLAFPRRRLHGGKTRSL